MHFALNIGAMRSIPMLTECHRFPKWTGATAISLVRKWRHCLVEGWGWGVGGEVTIPDESIASGLGLKRKWMMLCL